MTTTPKRRWFAYSLRTLFVVVTVFGLAVGWFIYQLNWIRQRREAMDKYSQTYNDPAERYEKEDGTIVSFHAPGLLWLFGERNVREFTMNVPENPDDPAMWFYSHPEVQRIQCLFPEAQVDGQYIGIH